MTIKEAVAEMIRLKGNDIFKDYKGFFEYLDDLATEYPKERKIIKRLLDEELLTVFINDNEKIENRIKILYDNFADLGLKEDYADFIIESLGIPLGWEQELLDLKANSLSQILNSDEDSQQYQVSDSVTDISLSEDILTQWGFIDKSSIPSVFNIPIIYRTLDGSEYRITKIDSEVFKDCDKLQLITIPDTVTEIGNSVFENCKALIKINIPDGVTKIGDRAFANCESLDSIIIPNSVTDIGIKAFSSCIKLKQFTLPTKYTIFKDDINEQIDSTLTENPTTKLTSQEIANLISNPTTKLTNLQITNYIESKLDYEVLKKLGYEIKYEEDESGILTFIKTNGKDVTFLDIPATYNYNGKNYKITQLEEFVFYRCASLTNVIIPNSVTQIGKMAFAGCQSLVSVNIPNSVTRIERSVFNNCSSLTSITIPDSVEEIDDSAFSDCLALKSVIVPDSVTKIGYNAFSKVKHIEYHGNATGAPWGAKSMN